MRAELKRGDLLKREAQSEEDDGLET